MTTICNRIRLSALRNQSQRYIQPLSKWNIYEPTMMVDDDDDPQYLLPSVACDNLILSHNVGSVSLGTYYLLCPCPLLCFCCNPNELRNVYPAICGRFQLVLDMVLIKYFSCYTPCSFRSSSSHTHHHHCMVPLPTMNSFRFLPESNKYPAPAFRGHKFNANPLDNRSRQKKLMAERWRG